MADLVQRNRFHVDTTRFSAGRGRPTEARIEKDIGLSNLPSRGIEQKAGRGKHAIEIRAIEKPECGAAVLGAWRSDGQSLKLALRGRRGNGLPRRKGATDGITR